MKDKEREGEERPRDVRVEVDRGEQWSGVLEEKERTGDLEAMEGGR